VIIFPPPANKILFIKREKKEWEERYVFVILAGKYFR